MAYENMTFDNILNNLLDRVPDSFDKREGSIIYDALAPAAVELANLYIELDNVLNETFADTASRYYLIKRAKERGLSPEQATYAILRAEFTPTDLEIEIGARFNGDDLNYKVIEKIGDGVYKVQCETAGTVGNGYFGTIIPIDYIQGLETARIVSNLIPGEDEEETEAFRTRYLASLTSQAYGGNVADYKEKVNSLAGVGGCKVYRASEWNGGGSVKIVIINSEFEEPSNDLVDSIQNEIDPETNHGEGMGIAPIGHIVSVAGVNVDEVTISTTLEYATGYNWDSIKNQFYEVIDEYFSELNQGWANSDNIVVRISQIESRILEITGIVDISNTLINNQANNYTLDKDSIVAREENE